MTGIKQMRTLHATNVAITVRALPRFLHSRPLRNHPPSAAQIGKLPAVALRLDCGNRRLSVSLYASVLTEVFHGAAIAFVMK